MKKEKIPMLVGAILIILLAFLIVLKADIMGVSGSRLEQEAREQQNVKSSWELAQAINEDICAMLFYEENRQEYVYSVYLTRGGMSYGYFFAEGGSDNHMTEKVKGIAFENKGIVLLSLNQDNICKIITGNDVDKETILVDSTKPFALVLPADCSEIVMYDTQDNIVTLYDTE